MTSPFQKLMGLDPTREQVEDWCRKQTQVIPAGNDALLCRVLGKYLMYVHARDYAITPHLAMNGIWEPWVTMAIARHVKPGMRCLDVGACYGYYALLMADLVGDNGYVEAWEPIWHYILIQNAQLNGASMKVEPTAMSTRQREIVLHRPRADGFFNAGDVGFHDVGSNERSAAQALGRFSTTRITSGEYDFVKIDVEGSEMDVWQSLDDVRDMSPNLTVCMEFTPKQHKDPRAALEMIVGDGFAMGSVGHDGVPRACSVDEALVPDTGDFRMLWLTRKS